MRAFSRSMPPAPEARVISSTVLLLVLTIVLVLLGLISTGALLAACGFIGFVGAGSAWLSHRMRRIAESRTGEDICTFARAFDRRVVDPWIIRAVYDGIQATFGGSAERFPVRATDRLSEDLGIVGEELDELAETVAQRTGRTLDGAAHNSGTGVDTVADLVLFLNRQPRRPAGAGSTADLARRRA